MATTNYITRSTCISIGEKRNQVRGCFWLGEAIEEERGGYKVGYGWFCCLMMGNARCLESELEGHINVSCPKLFSRHMHPSLSCLYENEGAQDDNSILSIHKVCVCHLLIALLLNRKVVYKL